MVSGFAWDQKTRPWFEPLLTRVVSPMEKLGIPWIYAIGNHDNQGDLKNRTAIMAFAQSFAHSLSHPGPAAVTGSSNYAVPVLSSAGDGKQRATLWAMDTGDNNCLGVEGWDCTTPDQNRWFQDTNRAVGHSIPGMMWMHIPVHEVMDMWNFHEVRGRLEDVGVCCPSLNTGLYSAAKEAGNIVSMAFGHDHSNDFLGDYHGITLAYGRKSGVGCYGPPPNMQRGARVWLVREPPAEAPLNLTFTTWIREENGAIETQSAQVHAPDAHDRFQVCCDAALVTGVPYTPRLPECERYSREWQLEHFGEIYTRQFMDADHDPGKNGHGQVRVVARDRGTRPV
jgi:hypothetical protein